MDSDFIKLLSMPKTLLPHEAFLDPLQLFAEQLTAKYSAKSAGEPEDQLKPPVEFTRGSNVG